VRWLALTLLQMSLAYALVDVLWQARSTILVAGLAGGAATMLLGALWIRQRPTPGRFVHDGYAGFVDRPLPDFARDSELVDASFRYACEKHAGDYRRGGEQVPYIEHPVEVARLVSGAGYPEPAVAAALLHDVVEDADPPVGPEEIDERFGVEVGTLVRALTENKLLDFGDKADPRIYELRKQLHREKVEVAGESAQAIYAADKLANVRDVTKVVRRDGPQIFDEFNVADCSTYIKKSRGELAMLRRVAPGMTLLDDLERALVELESACSVER